MSDIVERFFEIGLLPGGVIVRPGFDIHNPAHLEQLDQLLGSYERDYTRHVLGDEIRETLADLRRNLGSEADVRLERLLDKYTQLKTLGYESDLGAETLTGIQRVQAEVQARELRALRKSNQAGYVYLVKAETGQYKIGLSKDPHNRAKTFGVLLPFNVEFEALIKTDNMRLLEAQLHQRFASKRLYGEWFKLEPADVEYIKSLPGVCQEVQL